MAEYGLGYHYDDSGGAAMHRPIFIAAVLIAVLPSAPSFAVTAKEKMATCKFGADDQKLAGAARAKFMKNCMANKNDPRGGAGAAGAVPPPPKN
jgi:psiF repeat